MAVFRCKRFPNGEVPIRTRVGLVVFTDGRAEVTDPEQAQALREVPAAFGITEEGVAGAGDHGGAPPRPPVRARRTGKTSSTSTARR